jgi:hypothetical protein
MKFDFIWQGMKKDIEYVIKKGRFVKYTIGMQLSKIPFMRKIRGKL